MQYSKLEEFPRSEWGGIFWYMMHRLARSYDPLGSTYYYNLIVQYPFIIPCPICSYHFGDMLKRSQPKTDTGENLFEWTVSVHNVVNKRLKKRIVSQKEAKDIYDAPIENGKAIRFLQYLSDFLKIDANIYRINATIIALEAFIYTYPCEKCKIRLVKLNEKESLDTKNIETYIEKMIQILRQC